MKTPVSLPSTSFFSFTQLCAAKKSNNDNHNNSKKNSRKKKKTANNSDPGKPRKKMKKRKKKIDSSSSTNDDDDNLNISQTNSQLSKQELMKQVGESIKAAKRQQSQPQQSSASTSSSDASSSSVLDRFNPFKAGQELRKTIDTAISSTQPNKRRRTDSTSVYYLDDRLAGELNTNTNNNPANTANDLWSTTPDDDYVPEVLVVGALGDVGQSVVQRLLREGPRFRVRVLVPNLFMDSLEKFGTSVMYSQGDLQNSESLELAVTDVDKIIFCPTTMPAVNGDTSNPQRAAWAEQIDYHGMKNLVQAYQNVRHADYGTNQAAKRTLFKFSRIQDFDLFAMDDDTTTALDDNVDEYEYVDDTTTTATVEWDEYLLQDTGEWEYDDIDDNEDDDNALVEYRDDATITAQVQWLRNKFDHAVFVGRVPNTIAQDGTGAQAAIVSSRLRSRESPDLGIDLVSSFAGFILRVCSDGSEYEAFVRTSNYETDGIEYVCPFSTDTKAYQENNKSKNKFITVRLPFEKFQPVLTESSNGELDLTEIPVFFGQDVQQIGFRYRAASNKASDKVSNGFLSKRERRENENNLQSFYLAFSYIKLYRSQPEPEFIYVSDARVPSIVRSDMVNHNTKRIETWKTDTQSTVLIDDNAPIIHDAVNTEEEVYYKYVGEETLKKSGLAYSVVRVKEYQNTSQDSTLTEIALVSDNESATKVTQDQVAQICVSALLDPGALNKSFYAKSTKANPDGSNLSSQFESLPKDPVALP